MDYPKLGFKCGLEVHGQLDVGKLFCECEGRLRKDKPHFTVNRKLRAMAGESGYIDAAAAHAQAKGLRYVYEGYNDTTCLVELDEEPPHTVNKEALDAALTIATILHCDIADYVQVMRKTIVDGTNVSGFQRTSMIATNGYIEVGGDKISIIFVGLEEDAARRTAEDKETVTYRLDRLGIPLVEIATGPDIKTPEQAKAVALAIGMLIRATGKAMRGIGTIRQDVNVSIKNHPRIELKGFQDLKSMPETIKREVKRQQEVLYKKEKLESHVRNAKPDFTSKYLRPMPGSARMYPETDLTLIPISRDKRADIEKRLPELPDVKFNRLLKAGLNDVLASQVLFDDQFAYLHKKFKKLDPKLIATTLLSTQKEARKKADQDEGNFQQEHFEEIFKLLQDGKISKEAVLDMLVEVAKGETVASAAKKFKLMSDVELKKEIAKLKKKFAKVPENKLKGIVIGNLRGKADIQKIMKFL
ncbi:Glu-tRNA(Gln) amidotransferase subunit GatE [Candidatus Woesearchaeota archaeon]|nr:Glu-tRNA(Gln) amidotransferase subunit GatE [Candidatus Woesearchaeota archaeon]MBT4248184.1 Glu-tRNA(Gln) amidotransferase subunit GatE [Candidatus Woesearchaeota archaeon]